MPENEFNARMEIETMLLLKQKMCKTHNLIIQYSEKLKENSYMKSNLATAKKEAKRVICNYKSAMDKIKELELRITQSKQINEKLINQRNEYDVNKTADKQIIEQLTCKIEELEEKHSIKIMEYDLRKSAYQDKIKTLEQEFKKSESKLKRMGKKGIADMNTSKHDIEIKSTSDVGINVSMCDDAVSNRRPIVETQIKNIMTDDSIPIDAKSTSNIGIKSTSDVGINVSICDDTLNRRPIIETQDKSIMTDDSTPIDAKSTSNIGVKSTLDIGVNTSLCELNLRSKLETQDKNIMTDEFYNTTNNKFSLFPSNCETCSLLNEIKRLITYPKLIEEDLTSPRKKGSSIRNKCLSSDVSAIDLSNDLNCISATTNLFENTDCTKESLHSNDLLIKQSSSIKKIRKKLKLLESKMEKFQKLKEKPNIYSPPSKYNDTSLNPDLLSTFCKSIVQYCTEERREKKNACFRNEINEQNELTRYKRGTRMKKKKKKKKLKKYNTYEESFVWDAEHLDKNFSQNISCNRLEVAAKAIIVPQFEYDTSQYTTIHHTNKNNSILNICNSLDNKSDKESILCTRGNQENVSPIEVMSAEDSSVMSDLITNEISINHNSSCEDNAKNIDLNNQMETETTLLLSNSQNSIDHTNSEIEMENKIKKQKINFTNRLLKKIKNLKRKTKANLHMNKSNNNKSSSDYNFEHKKLTKSRIEKQEISNHPLKSINNLKRKLEMPANSSINMQKNTELYENYESMKKIRIAHVPKSLVFRSNVIQKDGMHHTIKNITISGTSQQNESESQRSTNSRNKSDVSCNDISHNIIKNIEFKKSIMPNTNIQFELSSSPCKNLKYDECNKDVEENIQMKKIGITEEATSISESISTSDNAMPNTNIQFEPPNSPCKDLKYDKYNKDVQENIQIKKIGIIEEATSISESKFTSNTNAEEDCNDYALPRDTILNDDRSFLKQSNSLEVSCHKSYDSSHNVFNTTSRSQNLPTSRDNGVIKNHIIATSKEKCTNHQEKATKCANVLHNVKKSQMLISWVVKYIKEKCARTRTKCQLSRKQMTCISTLTDKFVKKQLQRLADSAWEDTLYHEIIQNLTSTCGPRIIAKCIIEFLSENADDNNILDKSFTPPAPLMTTFEQKLTALLIDLEKSKPTIIHFVQAGIQYKLFKLNNEVKNLNEVDSLTRMYVVLSRIQKDREKIRIMCCDALYCMNLKSISLLYIVLTSWPEVLPNAEMNIGILPKCIAFLVGWQQVNDKEKTLNRLKILKSLITAFYNYAYSRETIEDLVKELTIILKVKQTDGLDTAIILIGKKKGPSWTYENIIKSTLLPMIINHEYPCIYNGFSLLGRLLRAFPLDKIVQDITEQLHDLIKSGKGSHDQQEGIISALLSLSRHKFDIIASTALRWTPNTPLRSVTMVQLEGFIRIRKIEF